MKISYKNKWYRKKGKIKKDKGMYCLLHIKGRPEEIKMFERYLCRFMREVKLHGISK